MGLRTLYCSCAARMRDSFVCVRMYRLSSSAAGVARLYGPILRSLK